VRLLFVSLAVSQFRDPNPEAATADQEHAVFDDLRHELRLPICKKCDNQSKKNYSANARE